MALCPGVSEKSKMGKTGAGHFREPEPFPWRHPRWEARPRRPCARPFRRASWGWGWRRPGSRPPCPCAGRAGVWDSLPTGKDTWGAAPQRTFRSGHWPHGLVRGGWGWAVETAWGGRWDSPQRSSVSPASACVAAKSTVVVCPNHMRSDGTGRRPPVSGAKTPNTVSRCGEPVATHPPGAGEVVPRT